MTLGESPEGHPRKNAETTKNERALQILKKADEGLLRVLEPTGEPAGSDAPHERFFSLAASVGDLEQIKDVLPALYQVSADKIIQHADDIRQICHQYELWT